MTMEIGKNVSSYFVGNSTNVKKQAEKDTKTSVNSDVSFKGEAGDSILDALGLQGVQQFNLGKVDKKDQPFDFKALTDQVGNLNQTTIDGLNFIGKNMAMFDNATKQFENSSSNPAEVLAKQNAFLKEFAF